MFARPVAWSLFGVVACSAARPALPNEGAPGVVVPMHLAEGHGDGAPAELPSASGSSAPGAAPATAQAAAPRAFSDDQPDPTPLRQAEQYEYTFHYENGTVTLANVRAVRYRQPIVTARRMGRFAVELWIGHELIDRVRFDFPLLADAEPAPSRHPLYDRPTKMAGPFDVVVVVPNAERARQARLVDRASRTDAELSWPPAPNGMGPMKPLPKPSATAPNASGSASPAAAPAPSGAVPTPTSKP
ncbi:MAG TPA: hypothetical protein VMI54_03510 [Polyangiaceae bacterium]|nr:hypothetical protein [Polyangiaceae bacterium]